MAHRGIRDTRFSRKPLHASALNLQGFFNQVNCVFGWHQVNLIDSLCNHISRDYKNSQPYYLKIFIRCYKLIVKMTLAAYLQRKREEKGLTQRQLAEHAGISQATIGRIEAFLTDAPGIDIILALARALRVPPENLLKAYQGIDPDEARPPEADIIEAEAEKAIEFLSRFIRKDRK